MKIAIVHSFYDNQQPSGENVAVTAQAELLASANHEVCLISQHTSSQKKNDPFFRIRAAGRVATGHGRSPLKALRDFQPDVVHVHNLFPNWGTSWLNHCTYPIATTVHNFRPLCAAGTLFRDNHECRLCPDGRRLEAVKNRCYRGSRPGSAALYLAGAGDATRSAVLDRADHTFLLSDRAASIYRTYGFTGPASVVPNFVEDDGPASRPPGADHWAYIGRLSPEKGVDKLLQHWPPGEKLRIYGSGPLESQLSTDLPLNINYMGQVNHDEIVGVLDGARGLVFPSVWPENSPLVYLEALARGRPVIAKSGNSVADDVAVGGTGRTFEHWTDLRSCLSLSDEELGDLGLAARRRFELKYSAAAWLSQTQRVYERLIRDGHRP